MCGSGVRMPGTTIIKAYLQTVAPWTAGARTLSEFCEAAPGATILSIAESPTATGTIQLIASTSMGFG